jgi:hypothetical protein
MGILKRLFVLGILIYTPSQTMAWGLLGHRVVGQIAECYLTKKTQREVQKILGNETLAMASNWADLIKSEPAYNYLSNWHFINLTAGLSTEQLSFILKRDTVTNAYTQIHFLTTELKNKALDQSKKQVYLRLLIHIVGDVHQPMHTGHFEDLGGNKIQLSWFGRNSNLHQVWDSDLIDSKQLSYTEYANSINFISKSLRDSLQAEEPGKWVQDSYLLSSRIYSNVRSGDKLSYRYIYDNQAIADKQLLKGAIHLAGLLNNIFSGKG